MVEKQGSTDSESDQNSPRGDLPTVELVRVIDRTIHVSSLDRKKEVDYTVRNTSDRNYNFIFLPLRQFELNLQAVDENGDVLNIYPNNYVWDMLNDVKDTNGDAYDRMENRFKHMNYRMYIQLPPERPIRPGELRTIRLTFEQSDAVEFHRITEPNIFRGWVSQWKMKFFRIPTFFIDVERFPGDSHDVFSVIVGTPGYAVTGTSEHNGGEADGTVYENGLMDDTRTASIRLPSVKNRRYTHKIQYDLIPNNRNLMRILSIYWVVSVVLGILSAALALSGQFSGLADLGKALSGGLITATIGLIFALSSEWTSRYRLLSIFPLLLHGGSWFFWSSIGPLYP